MSGKPQSNGEESAVEQMRESARELRREARALERKADELESRNGAQDTDTRDPDPEPEPESQDGDGLTCEGCGREFANAGAKARHEQACDGPEQESQDGDGISADGLDAGDVPAVVRNASDTKNRRTAERYNREPAPSDAGIADTAAKALVRAMGGEKPQYVAAFDSCDRDGCERGCNGLTADLCYKHQKAAESESDAGDDAGDAEAGDAGDEAGEFAGAEHAEIEQYVASTHGLGPIGAAEVARLVCEGECASIADALEQVREA